MMTVVWLAVLIVGAILEGFTVALISIWFSIGALIAMGAAALGISLWIQVILFIVVSLLCIIMIRPFAKRFLAKGTEKTNADRIIGADAIVTEPINNLNSTGQVQVLGTYWTARSEDMDEIPKGTEVQVLRIEGVKVIVKRK